MKGNTGNNLYANSVERKKRNEKKKISPEEVNKDVKETK